MKLDEAQRLVDRVHCNVIRTSMQEEGVLKGDIMHGYIDVDDPAWNRNQGDTIDLFDRLEACNRLTGDGTMTRAVLPNDVPIRISNGSHRLYAFCSHLVEHWDEIQNVKPPLQSRVVDKPFAEDLGKTVAEILAQDDAWWLVSIEYIRK